MDITPIAQTTGDYGARSANGHALDSSPTGTTSSLLEGFSRLSQGAERLQTLASQGNAALNQVREHATDVVTGLQGAASQAQDMARDLGRQATTLVAQGLQVITNFQDVINNAAKDQRVQDVLDFAKYPDREGVGILISKASKSRIAEIVVQKAAAAVSDAGQQVVNNLSLTFTQDIFKAAKSPEEAVNKGKDILAAILTVKASGHEPITVSKGSFEQIEQILDIAKANGIKMIVQIQDQNIRTEIEKKFGPELLAPESPTEEPPKEGGPNSSRRQSMT